MDVRLQLKTYNNYTSRVCLRAASAFFQIKCYRRIIVHSNENVTEGTMSEEECMTIDERRKYLHKMRIRSYSQDVDYLAITLVQDGPPSLLEAIMEPLRQEQP